MVADALLRCVVVAELAIDLVTVASVGGPGDRINLLESSALPVIRKVFEGPFGSPLSGPLISGRDAEEIISDSMIAPSAFEGVLLRGGRGGRAGRSAFGSGCAPEGRAEDACGCGTGRLSE